MNSNYNPEKTYIGIDPGTDGGIALLRGQRVDLLPIADTPFQRIADVLREANESGPCIVAIEEVHSMPRDGSRQAFKFGQIYGQLLGILIAHAIPYVTVTPSKWQTAIFESCDKIYRPLKAYPKDEAEPTPSEATPSPSSPSPGSVSELQLAEAEAKPTQASEAKPSKPKRKSRADLDTKKTSINASRRLFPRVSLLRNSKCKTPHDGLSDALLIAEYARRSNL